MHGSNSLVLNTPLNLDATLSSAQAFQWVRKGKGWLGVADGSVVYLAQSGNTLFYKVYGGGDWKPEDYFRLNDDYLHIVEEIDFDPLIRKLVKEQPGLRITRQDPWECLLMFVLSTNNNYKRIVKMTLSLNNAFGRKVDTEFGYVHVFPSVETLAETPLQELYACGLGYRAKYVFELARTIKDGGIELVKLRGIPYAQARFALLELPGVGPKVADCVSLFSLEKLESFPIDTWIRRVLAKFYPHLFGVELQNLLKNERKSLSPTIYSKIAQKIRSYFGAYAGYAQNQLYYHAKKLIRKRVY
ncbi:MAG: DNA glycosylase [Thermoprotei archaeon]